MEKFRVKDEIAAMQMSSCLFTDPHLTGGENSDQVLILFKTIELRFMWSNHGLTPDFTFDLCFLT